MSGWDLVEGKVKSDYISEEDLWSLFKYVFVGKSRKDTTYKFCLIKCILDNLDTEYEVYMVYADRSERIIKHYMGYDNIFKSFVKSYWNLVLKYKLRQRRPTKNNRDSKIETILRELVGDKYVGSALEYDNLSFKEKKSILNKVTNDCRRFVIGALYDDFKGYIYGYEKQGSGLELGECAYEFMCKYKKELELLNSYYWGMFLDDINKESGCYKILFDEFGYGLQHDIVGILNGHNMVQDKKKMSTARMKNKKNYYDEEEKFFELNMRFEGVDDIEIQNARQVLKSNQDKLVIEEEQEVDIKVMEEKSDKKYSEQQIRILNLLLEEDYDDLGVYVENIEGNLFLEVEKINEIAMGEIGDVIIENDGEIYYIIEDYIYYVKETIIFSNE